VDFDTIEAGDINGENNSVDKILDDSRNVFVLELPGGWVSGVLRLPSGRNDLECGIGIEDRD
jgi:hypothetical protein